MNESFPFARLEQMDNRFVREDVILNRGLRVKRKQCYFVAQSSFKNVMSFSTRTVCAENSFVSTVSPSVSIRDKCHETKL